MWVELCLSAQDAGKPTSLNGQAGVSTGQSELQNPWATLPCLCLGEKYSSVQINLLPVQPVALPINPCGAPWSDGALCRVVQRAAGVLLAIDEEGKLASTTISGGAVGTLNFWCHWWARAAGWACGV